MSLKLELKLEHDRCIRGQSVFFTITLTNAGSSPVEGIASFHPFNRALRLVVRPENGKRLAGWPDGFARRQRDAANLMHWKTRRITLGPGELRSTNGDVLAWVGELPPGASQITAVYDPMTALHEREIQSAPVTLLVTPARPSQVCAPRLPQVGYPVLLTTAWVHERGPQQKVFISGHSRRLPPNPAFGVEVTGLPAEARVVAATVELAAPGQVHLLWSTPRGGLEATLAKLDAHSRAAPAPIRAPWPNPVVLASPQTTARGELRAVLADAGMKQAQVLLAARLNQPRFHALDLRGAAPIGPHAVFWSQRDTLEFVWAAQKARTVQHISMDLEAPDEVLAGEVLAAPGAILRLDVAAESPAPQARRQGLLVERMPGEEPPEPQEDEEQAAPVVDPEDRYVLWALCARRVPAQLALIRRTLPRGPERDVARFEQPADLKGSLEAVDSLVAHRGIPMYLLRDESGAYWYASTTCGRLRRLDELAGATIKPEQFPALVASSRASQDPWVYLRFVSESEGGFKYVLLEPGGMADPYRLIEERVTALRWG